MWDFLCCWWSIFSWSGNLRVLCCGWSCCRSLWRLFSSWSGVLGCFFMLRVGGCCGRWILLFYLKVFWSRYFLEVLWCLVFLVLWGIGFLFCFLGCCWGKNGVWSCWIFLSWIWLVLVERWRGEGRFLMWRWWRS